MMLDHTLRNFLRKIAKPISHYHFCNKSGTKMIGVISILIVLIGLASTSCEEVQSLDIEINNENILVVEAVITNENKRHEVKLSRTLSDINNEAPTVSNAIVTISDGSQTSILTPDPTRPGIYLTDSMRALFNTAYLLYIKVDQTEYAATARAALGVPLSLINLQETEDGMLEYIYEDTANPSMMEIVVSWKEADTSANQSVTHQLHAFYYTLDVIDINRIFAPDKEKIIFPKGASIFRRQYGLTTNHQEFLRSILSETDWRGGVFDVAPGHVATNLSEGALGYFAVSMVQTDEITTEK